MFQGLLKHISMHIRSRDKSMHSNDISNTNQWTQESILNHKSTMNSRPCTHDKLTSMLHNEKYGVDYNVLISSTFE
jgi:hypothetical protein